MGGRRRRNRVEHTDGWEQIELLCGWPERRYYELIRPLVLFGGPLAERAQETHVAERTLYRRVSRFEAEGMESLFDSETARRRRTSSSSSSGSAREGWAHFCIGWRLLISSESTIEED